MKKAVLFLSLVLVTSLYMAFKKPEATGGKFAVAALKTGAEQTSKYLPYLKGKRVAILGNQTSVLGQKNLVDSLKTLGVNIVKVFGPEHGFRGNASNGAA